MSLDGINFFVEEGEIVNWSYHRRWWIPHVQHGKEGLFFTLTLNRPWSNIGTAHRVIVANISGKLLVNPTRGSKDIERTQNTVIQCLILNFDLGLQLTLVKHKHCTSSHYSWHSCKVICKSNQGFKRYRADTKYSHTMINLKLWPWPWTDIGQT